VLALLAWAESRGLGVPDTPGEREELKRILWGHARSKDRAHSIKASAELNKLEDADRASQEAEFQHDPTVTLNAVAEILPELALHWAKQHEIEWKPAPELHQKVQAARRAIALDWFAEQRAEEAAKLNGHGTSNPEQKEATHA
jgi:hypothetical protein